MTQTQPTPEPHPESERVLFLFDDEDQFLEGEVVDSKPVGGYNRDHDEMLWIDVPDRGTYRQLRSRTLNAQPVG